MGLSALILGGLIFAQSRRLIEKWDLLIIAGITFAIVFFVPVLRSGQSIEIVAFLAIIAGLVAIALTALVLIIRNLLLRLF